MRRVIKESETYTGPESLNRGHSFILYRLHYPTGNLIIQHFYDSLISKVEPKRKREERRKRREEELRMRRSPSVDGAELRRNLSFFGRRYTTLPEVHLS